MKALEERAVAADTKPFIAASAQIDVDAPLSPENALVNDALNRERFARSAVSALRCVNRTSSLVLSIEGAWGSGKTSTLSMIEALLKCEPEERRPVVVRFNPWLIGERDALLQAFLETLATAAGVTSHTVAALNAANQLRTYSKVFGVLKFVPGAEPWASLIEELLSKFGKASEAMAHAKTPDLEGQRENVISALRELKQPIVVFIDDIDRLFAQEVFEVIRIIKAVGDLPNIGYVIAWDAGYVVRALESLAVPFASSYPDKIVQIRLAIPTAPRSSREKLLSSALDSLGVEVTRQRFPRESDRLPLLYWSGLGDLLVHPRDARVFNTLRTIEPALRGEVVFADILGLAALKVKAPAVFSLLQKHPEYFVEGLDREEVGESREEIRSAAVEARKLAFAECEFPRATKSMIHHLFPSTARDDGAFAMGRVVNAEGHLASPERLVVALQAGVAESDVSIVAAQDYLRDASRRHEILKSVSLLNCVEFLRLIREVLEVQEVEVSDVKATCIDIARLVDNDVFVERKLSRRDGLLSRSTEVLAMQLVSQLAARQAKDQWAATAASLARDGEALTVAADLLRDSYLENDEKTRPEFVCPEADREQLLESFAENVLNAAKANTLTKRANPASILWHLAKLAPQYCPDVFAAIRSVDPTLDSFATEVFKHSYQNPGGQVYFMNDASYVAPFCNIEELLNHARKRISDGAALPALAAWKALAEGKGSVNPTV